MEEECHGTIHARYRFGEDYIPSGGDGPKPPPICPLRSSTVVLTPDAAGTIAAESPFGPEPIIVAVGIPQLLRASARRFCPGWRR